MNLPIEIWNYFILPYMPITELCRLRCLSKTFNSIVTRYFATKRSLDFDKEEADLLDEDGLGFILVYSKSLEYIDLGFCWKSATEKNLLLLTNRCLLIKTLVINHCSNVTNKVLVNLSQRCLGLECLDISFCYNVSDFGIRAVANHSKKLKELYISSDYGVSVECVALILKQCILLQKLDIGKTYLSDIALQGIQYEDHGQNLKEIRLYKCPNISQRMMEYLASQGLMVNCCF